MDLNILIWVNNNLHGSGVLTSIWKFITITGDTGLIWIILSLVLLIFKDTRKTGCTLLIAIAGSYVLCNLFLKNLIIRDRPFLESQELLEFLKGTGLEIPDESSFPSGHSSSSFAVAVTLLLKDKKWGTPSIIWASLIALSRIYMCVHYPTDVLAGAILGIIIGFVVHNFVYYFAKWWNKNKTSEVEVMPMIKRGMV